MPTITELMPPMKKTHARNNENLCLNSKTYVSNNGTYVPNNGTYAPNSETYAPNNKSYAPNSETYALNSKTYAPPVQGSLYRGLHTKAGLTSSHINIIKIGNQEPEL